MIYIDAVLNTDLLVISLEPVHAANNRDTHQTLRRTVFRPPSRGDGAIDIESYYQLIVVFITTHRKICQVLSGDAVPIMSPGGGLVELPCPSPLLR
jgi:hypothetical protein